MRMMGGEPLTRIEKSTIDEAFNDIYERYKKSIFSFCMVKLDYDVERSEDCTQEAFIVLYRRLKKGETFENPRAFLYKTAINFIHKSIEKTAKQLQNEIPIDDGGELLADRVRDVEDKIAFDEFSRRVDELLTVEERELFTLKYEKNLKISEIAQRCNLTPTNCAVKLSRIRARIKSELLEFL